MGEIINLIVSLKNSRNADVASLHLYCIYIYSTYISNYTDTIHNTIQRVIIEQISANTNVLPGTNSNEQSRMSVEGISFWCESSSDGD